jgi:hypothetical protein
MALRLAEGYERLAHQAERITDDRSITAETRPT